MRYSLATLLGIVSFIAVGCGALASSSLFMASVFFSLAVATLTAAVVGAAVTSGAARAFWIAFAVFGWMHFVLAIGPWFDDHTGELLVTRQALDRMGLAMNYDVSEHTQMPGIWLNLPYASGNRARSSYPHLAFVVIGQCLFSVAIGWIAGAVTSALYSRQAKGAGSRQP